METISYRLPVFEGPLDLLLHLVQKNKINIYDIPIAELLEQYLEAIERWKEADLEVASEFLEMAARLVQIKSSLLLPRQEEAERLRQELTGELIEYQLCQEAARRLAKRYIGGDVFVRGPEEREPDTTYRRRHEPEELLDAYLAAAGRGRRKLPPPAKAFSGIVSRTIVSVSSRITYVLGRLYQGRQVTCRTLYEASRSRSEMVATFLALLELIKDKRIWVEGEEADQQVRMRRADEADDEEPEEENTIGN